MARNPLTRLLQKAFASAAAGSTGQHHHATPAAKPSHIAAAPVEKPSNIAATPAPTAHSRRRFLQQSSLAAGSLLIPPILQPHRLDHPDSGVSHLDGSRIDVDTNSGPGNPGKIAIIGAGMAGLTAAYRLKQRGIPSTVYEAAGRVGGRMYTLKDEFGPGITTDIGGEFVDTTHTDILQLVKELGLELYDLRTDTLQHKTFWFDNRLLGEKELREAIQPYTDRLLKDIHSLPPVISHATADSFRHLDQLSILDYCRAIGISGWLFHFLDMVLTREYGMEASRQSAINFLIMFEAPMPADKDYELFGQDHEVFKIKGGSQHLSDKLYEQVKDQVQLGQKLAAVSENGQKGYHLHFGNKDGNAIVRADQVILALPFTILRSINLDIPMPAAKRKCIDEMGYGNSCKFIMGMDDKPWRNAGSQGYTFTDLSFGCGWDSSQLQSEKKGSFTVFGGGNFADGVPQYTEEQLALQFLPSLDRIYKGAAQAYNGHHKKFCWTDNPYSKAAYSAFKTGQWSTLAGWEGVPVGQLYFAGEHVSREFQGYMNGAAQTGRIAAEAVAANITKKIKI